MLIVEGKADKPVYLYIKDGEVTIRDAGALVGSSDQRDAGGRPGGARRQAGPRRHDRARRREPGALRLHHERALRRRRPRRSGGSHGLEEPQGHRCAGHRPAPRLRPRGCEGLQQLAHQGSLGSLLDPAGAAGVRHRGAGDGGAWRPSATFPCTTGGALRSPTGIKNVHGGALKDKMGLAQEGCFGCPLRCKKRLQSGAPYFVDPEYGGPEYEAHVRTRHQPRSGRRRRPWSRPTRSATRTPSMSSPWATPLVRHGVLRKGSADPRRHRRSRPALRQRPGLGQVRGAHRPARGHRRVCCPWARPRRPRGSAAGRRRSPWRSRASIRACTSLV